MDIKSLPLNELTEYIVDKGFPAFRAKQLYTWLHKKLIRDAEEISTGILFAYLHRPDAGWVVVFAHQRCWGYQEILLFQKC